MSGLPQTADIYGPGRALRICANNGSAWRSGYEGGEKMAAEKARLEQP